MEKTDDQFLDGTVDKIDGWLLRPAAHLTIDLLRNQRAFAAERPILEIGIYQGKYLAILLNEAKLSGSPVLGVDTFQFITPEEVKAGLARHFDNLSILAMHKGPSNELTAHDYISRMGGRPRFISIDGSHMAPDVLHDLNLSAEIADDACIVAIDDFANTMTLGVNEAVARFMIADGGQHLSPFCFCANKLFMCRPHFRPTYLQWAESFIRQHTEYRGCQQFVDLEKTWRGSVEINYFGNTLLNVMA